MIKRNETLPRGQKKMFDGAGEVRNIQILQSGEEMYNKGRVFNHVFLDPGCEVGWHVHHGDGETYYILKGTGEYNDNGTLVQVYPGDMTFVDDGEGHSIKNTGDETLEAIALILFK